MKNSDFRDLVKILEQAALHASGGDDTGLRIHVREPPAKNEPDLKNGATAQSDRPYLV